MRISMILTTTAIALIAVTSALASDRQNEVAAPQVIVSTVGYNLSNPQDIARLHKQLSHVVKAMCYNDVFWVVTYTGFSCYKTALSDGEAQIAHGVALASGYNESADATSAVGRPGVPTSTYQNAKR